MHQLAEYLECLRREPIERQGQLHEDLDRLTGIGRRRIVSHFCDEGRQVPVRLNQGLSPCPTNPQLGAFLNQIPWNKIGAEKQPGGRGLVPDLTDAKWRKGSPGGTNP